jgi:Short-chain alcohol dehydrogenase of unknown specificity
MNTEKVWFITGASKGLGLHFVQALLKQGYLVAATSRNKAALVDIIGENENFLPLSMDVTNDGDVKYNIDKVIETFGKIDVVVNNAGYSQIGTLEELSDAEARKNFDVNVFGVLNVIRHVAPYLREQQSGHIFNISSIGGYLGNFPAFGIYCSTKFAVAGFTEALAEELRPFGVYTTLIYPGYFRTSFLSKDSVMSPSKPIDAYINARAVQSAHLNDINGNQPNDPQKAAEVLIELSKQANPPVHFFMGIGVDEFVQGKIDVIKSELEKNKILSLSTAVATS